MHTMEYYIVIKSDLCDLCLLTLEDVHDIFKGKMRFQNIMHGMILLFQTSGYLYIYIYMHAYI